jgi:hypothetical protein
MAAPRTSQSEMAQGDGQPPSIASLNRSDSLNFNARAVPAR